MTSLTISDIEPTLAERLRLRAAEHGLSMEAEAYSILKGALDRQTFGMDSVADSDLYMRIHARFASLGGEDIVIAPRETGREPPHFD